MTSTRVLFVSGSIGLGHATRDLAIARQLRRLNPGGMLGYGYGGGRPGAWLARGLPWGGGFFTPAPSFCPSNGKRQPVPLAVTLAGSFLFGYNP